MRVLVTGGMGFIGSHTVVELLSEGNEVTIVDNLDNSDRKVLQRIQAISGKSPKFIEANVLDTPFITKILRENHIDAVIHFAALKAVGESLQKPLTYYQNNVGGLLSLLKAMEQTSKTKLIFSSSATVYGEPDSLPIYETHPLKATTNPYGETKKIAERILSDVGSATKLRTVILRYFNPIGAHPSGQLGESPPDLPSNLVPYLVQAASGIRDQLTIYGDNYDTPDGSCIRDYIHVVDLAKAHVKALAYLPRQKNPTSIYNIGTGRGTSVFELIRLFEKTNQIKLPYVVGPRRPGDVPQCYANTDRATKELGWKAQLSIESALHDAWNWHQYSQS